MRPPRPFAFACLFALTLLLAAHSYAQELREHPTPFSVWLDFQALFSGQPPRVALPIWLESLREEPRPAHDGVPQSTIFRLRFRRIGALNRELQLRLFFDDDPATSPKITGWSETGAPRFSRGPLGNGLELPTSESLTLPMAGVDYVDIETPGDGGNLRGAFLASIQRSEMQHAVDFPPASSAIDVFDNLPPATPKSDDDKLFGRVKATIDPGALKLAPRVAPAATWEFDLQGPPLVAVVTFEILNGDALAPPTVLVNDRALGAASIHFPDLADPAYLGFVRPLDRDMRFRYTGWLRCQKVIPGSALRAGLNQVILQLHPESGPIGVRAVELQLKHNWRNLDYRLSPSTP